MSKGEIGKHYERIYEEARKAQKASLRLLGADAAEAWLKKNTRNRPLGMRTAEYYGRLMATGQWDINGQPIVLGENGEPLNAQHRLHGLILADQQVPGIKVPFWVITGVPVSTFGSMDTGRARSGGDQLAIAGEAHASILSSAADLLARYELTGSLINVRLKVSHQERMDLLARRPDLRQSVAYLHSHAKKGKHPASLLAALHHLTVQANPAKAADFWEQVLDRATVFHGSVVWLLNQKLESIVKLRAMAYRDEITVVTIKAWNAFAEGRSLAELRRRRFKDGSLEGCPEISSGSKKTTGDSQ